MNTCALSPWPAQACLHHLSLGLHWQYTFTHMPAHAKAALRLPRMCDVHMRTHQDSAMLAEDMCKEHLLIRLPH